MTVTVTHTDRIAIVTIDNPPVNAIGQSVRDGLLAVVKDTAANPTIDAIILICLGATFMSGADIREFDRPPAPPHLPDVVQAIAMTEKPWIAAIHGTALGGGLEIALACRYRICTSTAKLGFPEVTLGVVPGAGGTVMLPRLTDPSRALDVIATGKPITARQAQEDGLIDLICDDDLAGHADRFARSILDQTHPLTVFQRQPQPIKDPAAFDKTAQRIIARAKGQNAPRAVINLVKNALTLNFQDALQAEREIFLSLRASDQAKALRHIFFAERATTKSIGVTPVPPRDFETIGVIGGGTMGAGIAAACLLSGLKVVMVERDAAAAQKGADRLAAILGDALTRGVITENAKHTFLGAFHASCDYGDLKQADIVIEAAFEDLTIKQEIFARLDTITKPTAILATNTSYLDVNLIARAVSDRSRVIGLHFFSPAHIMKLLEVITPDHVAPDVVATALAFGKRLRKICVLAGVCDGFIANRIMSAYRRDCEYMLEDGALPWDIDRAMVSFGMPMGIFQMQDLAGLDIAWAMRKRQAATRPPTQRYVHIADTLCNLGRFGRKTGRGWYHYTNQGGQPDPEVEQIIQAASHEKGIKRRHFDDDEIMTRILRIIHSEGNALLSKGIARAAADIDVVMVNAFGFPRWRGGPMYMQTLEKGGVVPSPV